MNSPAPEPKPEGKAGAASAGAGAQPSSGEQSGQRGPEAALPSVPDHELLRCIGHGAYGAVWLARNVMGTYRAVKIVHREDFTRDRPFVREYEGLLKFEPISRSHPNLMQILHVGRRANYFYYVTELADDASQVKSEECRVKNGETRSQQAPPSDFGSQTSDSLSAPGLRASEFGLRTSDLSFYVPRTLQEDLERRGRLPVRECVGLAGALASALKHLHEHGLVHRDVKPSNVIFVHGVPKLADVGLVTTASDSRSIVGTEGYLPPEGPGTAQADLYATGKLLYEVSSGRNRAHFPCLPDNLETMPDATELLEFNEVLLRACARDTERRYHTADELLADLALLERGDSVKRLRRLERHQAALKRVGVGLLAIGLLLSAAWWQTRRAHRIASRHLAQRFVDEGTREMVDGEYAAALPWLVGALELEAGDAERERVHRTRIANVLRRCPLPIAHFTSPDSVVLGADLSPEGTLLATAHEDGWVQLWDTRSGKVIRRLPQNDPAGLCQFLPGGDRLISASFEQKTCLWDLAKPEAPRTFDQVVVGSSHPIYSLGLNESKGWAYLSKNWYCFARHQDFTGPFEHLTLSLKLAGKGDVLSLQYEVRRTTAPGDVLCRGEFRDSPAADPFEEGRDKLATPLWGQLFLALEHASTGEGAEDKGQAIWDKVQVRRYRSDGPPPPWQVLDDFSSSSLAKWVYLNLPEEKRSCRVENGQLVLSCERLPRGQGVSGLLACREPLEVSPTHTLEIEADLVSASAPHPVVALSVFRPFASPFAPAGGGSYVAHGRWLLTTWWEGPVKIWDLGDPRSGATRDPGSDRPRELGFRGPVQELDFSSDTNCIAIVNLAAQLSVWDFRSGAEIALAGMKPVGVTGARFSPDSRFLAVSHKDGLDLLRTAEWRLARTLANGASFLNPRFNPSGSRLAAVRDGRNVVVWDLGELPEPIATFAHESDVARLVFSPGGRYLATDTADRQVQVWDLLRSAPFGPPLPGALGQFTPDGTQLLIYGTEGGVWFWDLSQMTDEALLLPPVLEEQLPASSTHATMTATIEGQRLVLKTPTARHSLVHPVRLRRVAFSSDDQYLVAESWDLRGWIWDLPTRTLVGPPWPVRYDAALATFSVPSLASENRDRRTLSDLAALLGQQRPDGAGGMQTVEDTQRPQLLADLKRAHPADFEPDESRRLRWHREQACAAESAMDWETAVFHWERAVDEQSKIKNQKSKIPPEARLAYARQAAEVVKQELMQGKSRWSVILPRPPWATAAMLDLGTHYTRALGEPVSKERGAATFRTLPGGVQVLGGTGFDVRGLIDLGSTNSVKIPVGRPCERVHFLHAASQQPAAVREPVGVYQVTYANGLTAAVELSNPEHVRPYSAHQFHALSPVAPTNALTRLRSRLAWAGSSPGPEQRPMGLFLTCTTWQLPEDRRGQIVASLELQAGSAGSAPLIFAITLE